MIRGSASDFSLVSDVNTVKFTILPQSSEKVAISFYCLVFVSFFLRAKPKSKRGDVGFGEIRPTKAYATGYLLSRILSQAHTSILEECPALWPDTRP